MLRKIRELSDVLPELLIGILLWGILGQFTLVWFVTEKLAYSIGLWIGAATAVLMAIHMAWSLDRALDLEQDRAARIMQKYNLMRYGAVLVVLGLLMISDFANPLAAFLGIMGLKVAAYLQPVTHKLFRR